jgi:hypothetical protein
MRDLLAVLVVVAGLLVALPADADAGSFAFTDAKVTVDVPDTWATSAKTGNVTFSTRDQSLAINLAFAGTKLDDAWDLLVTQVNKVVTGVTVSKKAGVLSGMAGYVDHSKGTFNGGDVACLLAAVQTPSGIMTIFVLGQLGKYEQHDDEMNQILFGMVADGARTGGEIAFDAAIAADAHDAVTRLATAIHGNDTAAFLALVSPKGLARANARGKRKVTKPAKLKKAIEKAKTITAYLGLPASGAWQATAAGKKVELRRGELPVIELARVKGAWVVTGTRAQ